LILTHTLARDPRVQLLMESGVPFVTHGRTEFGTRHPFHDFHSEEFVRLSVERLAARGCRTAMLVIGGEVTNNYRTIVSSFERAATSLGIAPTVSRIEGDRSPADLRQLGRDLARAQHRPDGIVCDSEMRAICIISGLEDEGLHVPADMQFVCKQTSDVLPALFPAVDTIAEDIFAAGVELTRLLIRRIAGESPTGLQTLGEPEARWKS